MRKAVEDAFRRLDQELVAAANHQSTRPRDATMYIALANRIQDIRRSYADFLKEDKKL